MGQIDTYRQSLPWEDKEEKEKKIDRKVQMTELIWFRHQIDWSSWLLSTRPLKFFEHYYYPRRPLHNFSIPNFRNEWMKKLKAYLFSLSTDTIRFFQCFPLGFDIRPNPFLRPPLQTFVYRNKLQKYLFICLYPNYSYSALSPRSWIIKRFPLPEEDPFFSVVHWIFDSIEFLLHSFRLACNLTSYLSKHICLDKY